jgi:hypothetical protein
MLYALGILLGSETFNIEVPHTYMHSAYVHPLRTFSPDWLIG